MSTRTYSAASRPFLTKSTDAQIADLLKGTRTDDNRCGLTLLYSLYVNGSWDPTEDLVLQEFAVAEAAEVQKAATNWNKQINAPQMRVYEERRDILLAACKSPAPAPELEVDASELIMTFQDQMHVLSAELTTTSVDIEPWSRSCTIKGDPLTLTVDIEGQAVLVRYIDPNGPLYAELCVNGTVLKAGVQEPALEISQKSPLKFEWEGVRSTQCLTLFGYHLKAKDPRRPRVESAI